MISDDLLVSWRAQSILSCRTIGDLVMTYLRWMQAETGNREVVLSLNRQELADLLDVHRTALSRTLAQLVAALTTLAGAATGNPTVMGSGILAGSRTSLYSDFASVRKITAVKERNVIYLDARLNHNRIYVEDADFDEVYDFIAKRGSAIGLSIPGGGHVWVTNYNCGDGTDENQAVPMSVAPRSAG